jgi:hypothetical protein
MEDEVLLVKIREMPLQRVALLFTSAGLATALFFYAVLLGAMSLNLHPFIRNKLEQLTFVFWPSSIMLLAIHETGAVSLNTILITVFSVLVNAFLYFLIGTLVWLFFRFVATFAHTGKGSPCTY